MSYFIPFQPITNINYVYLLCLYKIAEYNRTTKIKDTIRYSSIKDLSNRIEKKTGIKIKETTLYNFINKQSGNGYFILDSSNKRITLYNNYRKNFQHNQITAFVILEEPQINIILKMNQQLFSKYFIYLVYHCNGGRKSDHTIQQFLSASGYSTNSSYVSKVSEYNTFLQNKGFIKIKRYHDESGHIRNIYSVT